MKNTPLPCLFLPSMAGHARWLAAVLVVFCDVRKSRITFGCLGCVWIAGKLITHARLNRERVAFEMRPLVTKS